MHVCFCISFSLDPLTAKREQALLYRALDEVQTMVDHSLLSCVASAAVYETLCGVEAVVHSHIKQ